jgi:hypothetical protein
MRRLVYNDMKEGLERRVEMKEVSEETMAYFTEFCYSGNYTPPQAWNCYQLRHESTSGKIVSGQEAVLIHARLYVFAEIYNIEVLRNLCLENLKRIMKQFKGTDLLVVGSIALLAEYALENIPEHPATDPLVALLAKCTASMMYSPSSSEPLISLLASVNRRDFFDIFCQNITRNVSSPWP